MEKQSQIEKSANGASRPVSQVTQGSGDGLDASPLTHKVGDSIEKVGSRMERAGLKKSGAAVGRIGDKVEHLAEENLGADWVSDITAKAAEFETTLQGLVRKRPWTVLAGAVAVGFAANYLLSKKGSKE